MTLHELLERRMREDEARLEEAESAEFWENAAARADSISDAEWDAVDRTIDELAVIDDRPGKRPTKEEGANP